MKKEGLLALIVIFLLSFISGFDSSSSTYSVGSFNTGISGGNLSSSSYSSRFSTQYQQGVVDGESSSYVSTIGWLYTNFCGDKTCDAEETCSSCPLDCGACPSSGTTTTTTPSAGGGGGACSYDWVCSEWYPEPCPPEGIQKRVCVNRGTCNGDLGIPELEQNCIPSFIPPTDPLFDISLKIPLFRKWIPKGDFVDADVELINVGNKTTIDILFKYWIVDENNRLILEKQETRAIGEYEKFTIRFPLSKNLNKGIYKMYVHISYDDGKVALAGDSFEIFQSTFSLIVRIILLPLLILLVGIVLIFIALKVLRKLKGRKKKPKKKFKRFFVHKKKTEEKGFNDYRRKIRRNIGK